ncbi:MAG: Holliday junction branch migration protein RuvA [Actinomycetota bacterium]|nr:Holliday junction branch migration protein RuvA [Actinomycetota bacterium]
MIGSLRGEVIEVWDGGVLLEVGGVGYRLLMPAADVGRCRPGEGMFAHVHTHVREDALILYGFAERDALVSFEALLGAHGVGPALALAILSVHTPASLRTAVSSGDASALTAVPGVGSKTAARLLLELESRLGPDSGATGSGRIAPGGRAGMGLRSEVGAALSGLGYGPEEVRAATMRLPDEGSVEELLRMALKEISSAGG